jgi:hypothetical protein
MARDFKPRGVGVVLDDAIALYRANWRALLTLTLLVLAPVSIAYSITSTFYVRAFAEFFGALITSTASRATPPTADPAISVIALIASSVGMLWWLVRVYFTATLYSNAGPLLEGRTLTVREMLKAGLPAFVPLFVVELVVSLVVGILGPFTLYVGSAVAGVLLAMAGPVVVIEGGIGSAFARSYSLVRKHFWRVALLVTGAYLISTQFEAALASPVVVREIVFGAQNMSVLTSKIAWNWKVFDGTLQGLAMALVLPFLQLTFLLGYLDLRAREEGMDLVIRARALRDAG